MEIIFAITKRTYKQNNYCVLITFEHVIHGIVGNVKLFTSITHIQYLKKKTKKNYKNDSFVVVLNERFLFLLTLNY